MKRLFAAVAAALMVLSFAGSAIAAPPSTAPGKNPLICSEVLPENCTIVNKTSAIIDTRNGGGAAVYYEGFNSSWYGVKTSLVRDLSNTVSGDPLGIDPRWSIPIDDRSIGTNANGTTDYWLFVSFADCNNGAGLVDVINDATCTIYRSDTGQSYPNWSSFAQLNTSTYIALTDNYTFIIADGSGAPGVWTISNVKVGKPGK
jgi:hypothetical protein